MRFTDKYVGSYLQIYNIVLTNMLSVRVADFEVIRYGVAICGKRVFEYINLKNMTGLCPDRRV